MIADAIKLVTTSGGTTSEVVRYLHTDHLNTPRLATNAAGVKVWGWEGEACGATVPTGSVTINLRFPGQYYDAESGLHYNWNRYYDPKLCRYVTSDPIGLEGGLNTYLYANANPLRFTDPLGLFVPGPRPPIPPGPFGPVCGSGGNASWVPDGIFTGACQRHDDCYNCSGTAKKKCDDNFCEELKQACRIPGPGSKGIPICYLIANTYCSAVRLRGEPYYKEKGRPPCPCDGPTK